MKILLKMIYYKTFNKSMMMMKLTANLQVQISFLKCFHPYLMQVLRNLQLARNHLKKLIVKKMMMKLQKSKICCIMLKKIYLNKLGCKQQKLQYTFQIMKKKKIATSKINLTCPKIKIGKNKTIPPALAWIKVRKQVKYLWKSTK